MSIQMRKLTGVVALAGVVASAASCGDVARDGRSPMYLVIDQLQGASGGGHNPNIFGGTLNSDVIVMVTSPAPCTIATPCPTVFDDSGQVIFHLDPKNIGTTANPTTPTSNNAVTITRYHVDYVRADGRNTPGVDVPYGFDGAATGTVPPTGQFTLGFELVRHDAKFEAPLVQLVNNGGIINTIANVTFYGADRVGNAIQATGSILVNFGNFGDQ
jgi:hypothetical protein